MANVTFDEEPSYSLPVRTASKGINGGIPAWLVAHKFAKNVRGANIVLIVIVSICLILGIVLFVSAMNSHTLSKQDQERIKNSIHS